MPAKTQNPTHVQSQKVPVLPMRQTILLPRRSSGSRGNPSRREGLPMRPMSSVLHKSRVAAQTHAAARDARGQIQMRGMWPLLPLFQSSPRAHLRPHRRAPVRLLVRRLHGGVRPGIRPGHTHADAHRPEGL
uniref:(northern house mosquito) hypothetical protein n=1 Tax=Culex pipiens TaxID=7175 RepID=A0A8D8CTM0_CULPI